MVDDAIEAAMPQFDIRMNDAAMARTLEGWMASDFSQFSCCSAL
jgi:hypothetical protein